MLSTLRISNRRYSNAKMGLTTSLNFPAGHA